jgi:serine phosphatase RsbU (regulator of sigma subunit)
MFAAVLRSTIRSMSHLYARPGELLAAANKILFPDLSLVDMFVTAKLVYVDVARGTLVSASAGHCPLLVWCPGDPSAAVPDEPGFPLGIEPEEKYPQTLTPLPRGGAALLYTDGVTELRNADGEMLGGQKLQQLFAAVAAATSDAAVAKNFLLERLAAARAAAPLLDDQTFIFIRHLA